MKMQAIRIGAASLMAAALIGTGIAAPKADAASQSNFSVKTVWSQFNYEVIQNLANKYGIDLSKAKIYVNGALVKWPSGGTPTTKPTPQPTTQPPTKPTPQPTTQPTTKPTPQPTTKPTTTPSEGTETGTLQSQVVALVNQERAKQGLPALQVDSLLNKVATEKARDMDVNGYFSHTSPTYGSPFDMMRSYGVTYRYAGENIASGQRTAAQVMNDWMNSSGHRANILNQNFTKIGVGYVNGKWVQMFIG